MWETLFSNKTHFLGQYVHVSAQWYACRVFNDAGICVFDGTGNNGLYTGELVKQLQISQRIEDVFINTRIAVERLSNGRQSPWELARLKGKYFLK